MKIRGANLGEKDVEYKLLSEYPFFSDERQEIVMKLEQLFLGYQEECKKTQVKPFPQNDDKVEIFPGMVTHSCSNSLESLNTLSQYGVLASEWFGQIESEREGVFCSFIDRVHKQDNSDMKKSDRARVLNLKRLKSMSRNIILFFDDTNPVMKQLLHLDYFEYEKVKQQTPDKLTEIYTSDEIELFEHIIEPLSPGGRNFHTNDMLPYSDWSAIPGGIPSALVNGICTKSFKYDKEYIEEMARLFPNATIFNDELEILHSPLKIKSTQQLGQETMDEQKDTALLNEIEQTQNGHEKVADKERKNK